MSSSRDSLIAALEVILADVAGLEDVRLVKSSRDLGVLSKPTIIVARGTYEVNAAAPRSSAIGQFTLVLVSPHTDVDKSEEQLDDLLEILLPALLTATTSWSSAEPTVFDDTHDSYDIAVTALLSQE
jgi:hypothetical protein